MDLRKCGPAPGKMKKLAKEAVIATDLHGAYIRPTEHIEHSFHLQATNQMSLQDIFIAICLIYGNKIISNRFYPDNNGCKC